MRMRYCTENDMKINKNFIQKDVGGSHIVMAVGEDAAKLNGMITLNESAYYIWQRLEKGMERDAILSDMICDFEGASAEEIEGDLDTFITKLTEKNILI